MKATTKKQSFVSLPPPSREMIKSCFVKIVSYHKQLLKNRFLQANLSGDKMIINYKTKGGYFTSASFNSNGKCIMKEYFKQYDIETGRLRDYLYTRRMVELFG